VYKSTHRGSAVKKNICYHVFQLGAMGEIWRFNPDILARYSEEQASLKCTSVSAVNALLSLIADFDFDTGTVLVLCMTKNICKTVKQMLEVDPSMQDRNLRIGQATAGDDSAISQYQDESLDDMNRRISIMIATSIAGSSLSAMHCKKTIMLGAYSLSDVVQGSQRCCRGMYESFCVYA
jgi:hypothetical protein